VSEAAHRTPPGKDAGGTEITPSPCKVAFSAFDMIFFQQHEENFEFFQSSPFLMFIFFSIKH